MKTGLRLAAAPLANTLVELTWREKKIEHWIRFGRIAAEQRVDHQRRVVAFNSGSIFAFVRWAGNEYGTVISRIDIVRAVAASEPFQTLPFVRPGGEILLEIDGWPKVERVLLLIDEIERIGIDPEAVSPDHWRHVHNRLTAGHEPRGYALDHHRAFLARRGAKP